jgi:outer membrane protein OmpA-like peptidoglycan-associated protein
MSHRIALLSAALLAVALPAHAQFGDLLNRAQKTAADAAEKAARDAAAKPAHEPPAEPPPAATPSTEPARQESAKPAGAAPTGAPATPPSPEAYGNRYDFVPGDKVLVFDDFSDTDVGEYPAKWTIKGGGGNSLEVVQVGDRRFLKSRYSPQSQGWAQTWLRYEIKEDMPKNFTIEYDMDLGGRTGFMFSKWAGYGGQAVKIHASDETQVKSSNANGKLPVKTGVQHVAIAVSGTQLKVYVAGERVLSDPDGVVRPITRLGIEFEAPYQQEGDHQMITNLRIAEGGKPAKQMLAGEGRIVTHGILFDTGSDVIKPESGPTLRSILALLKEDPGLRFAIEGHTDDQGGPKVNGPLSERRAAAVKAWLVKQGIDAGRLTSKGLGQSKPIDSNETAEGRANNRRVEFVKIAS